MCFSNGLEVGAFFLALGAVGACIGVIVLTEGLLGARAKAGGVAAAIARLVNLLRLGCCVACMAIGIAVFTVVVTELRYSKSSMRWPDAPARVIAATAMPMGHSDFRISILYRYNVGSQVYESEQVQFGQLSPEVMSQEPQVWLQRYPVGATVVARYDSRCPARAVLEPGKHGSQIYWLLAVAIGPFLAGIHLIVVWRRRRRALMS